MPEHCPQLPGINYDLLKQAERMRLQKSKGARVYKPSTWLMPLAQPVCEPKVEANEVGSTVSAETASPVLNTEQFVTVAPSIVHAALSQQETPQLRIWYLLRHLDCAGRGWLSIDDIRTQLTKKQSKIRIVGWRRLRQILAVGEGRFWRRDKTRIWLYSAAKVAASLKIGKLRGHNVQIPLQALTQSIHHVRAHFFATFHSGRSSEAPVSRAAMREATTVAERTQFNYDRTTCTEATTNIAIMSTAATTATMQDAAYQHGAAVYKYVDYKGQHGAKNALCIVRQLPNSYTISTHQRAAKGRKKKTNAALIDLVKIQAQGNNERRIRRYHETAKQALRAQRKAAHSILWKGAEQKQQHRALWNQIR